MRRLFTIAAVVLAAGSVIFARSGMQASGQEPEAEKKLIEMGSQFASYLQKRRDGKVFTQPYSPCTAFASPSSPHWLWRGRCRFRYCKSWLATAGC